ncbi:MAG: glutamate formimidoyltransferase [Bryobacteraceae bacterium]
MLECVPNFSVGPNPAIVESLAGSIASVTGAAVLGHESDADHNRTVITFVGSRGSIVEAAVRGVERAVELIDVTRHRGVHPRLGAADVVPFIPMAGSTMADAVEAAHAAGAAIWDRLRVPVYFYEHAALQSGRRPLQKVRRQGYEQLLADFDTHRPNVGDALHPTAGAVLIGARDFLVAYNVLLETNDVAVAQRSAAAIRESSGGFPFVKALGLFLQSERRAQISMNLTRFAAIPLAEVYAAIESRAASEGTRIHTSELIGFVPQAAFKLAPEIYCQCRNFGEDRILERRMAALGLALPDRGAERP